MPEPNEKDEITRVVCAALDNDLCRITYMGAGFYDVHPFQLHDYWRVFEEDREVLGNSCIRVGKKRMEQIVNAIKQAQARSK